MTVVILPPPGPQQSAIKVHPLVDATGLLVGRLTCPDNEVEANTPSGQTVVPTMPPHPLALWNGTSWDLPSTAAKLAAAKDARWAEALAYRTARQEGGCATPLGRVDTDADSQRKINAAVTAVMAAQAVGAPFDPIGWTMADNSVVSHGGAAMIAMGLTVVGFVNACQRAAAAVRAEIEAAGSIATLNAIDITAGYPT